MSINTFMMGVLIRVTQKMVLETFDMPNKGLDVKPPRVISHDNAPDLPFHEGILHLFISHFF